MTIAAFPSDLVVMARTSAPNGVQVISVPDGDRPRLEAKLAGVEFLVLDIERRSDVGKILGSLESLRVVQVLLSGTDWIEPCIPPGVTLCAMKGAREVAVTEWVIAALTGWATGLLDAVRRQHTGEWQRSTSGELEGQCIVVVGMGAIGELVRARLEAMGVRVVGIGRHERENVRSVAALADVLPAADAVVILTPLTGETRGMVDGSFLSQLRDGALLVNAGRGAVVDTVALTRELEAGRIAAVLDVAEPEPLPPDHPLWTLPGCYISPHIAGATKPARRRAGRIAMNQLSRYVEPAPLLYVAPGAPAPRARTRLGEDGWSKT